MSEPIHLERIADRSTYGGNPKEMYDRLSRRVEATKTIRFEANKRLLRRHRLSGSVTAILSLYVIGLSLLPNIFSLQEKQNQVLLSCTIIMSTFIIILSLTEGSESFHHKAELMHESARELSKISFRLFQIEENNPDAIKLISLISEDYDRAILGCPVNHDNCDYLRVRARRPDLFGIARPRPAIGVVAKFAIYFKRTADFVTAVVAEFFWISVPLITAMISSWIVFGVIKDGWPN